MTISLKYRRRREGKTNYHKRLKLLSGGQTRVVIRRSNTGLIVQFVDYQQAGDLVRAQATAADVRKSGMTMTSGKSIPAAYLTGYIAGLRAKKAGVSGAIADLGMQTSTKGNRLYAALKGAIDAGLEIPVGEDYLPSADRIEGKHIAAHRTVTIDLKAYKDKARTL